MSASVSPEGFAIAGRGDRGYRPDQVDRSVSEASGERDAAWERAARLTVLANEMEAEAARLRGQVSQLAPQTYESLSERAQQLLSIAEDESEQLRTDATAAARQAYGEAQAHAQATADAARALDAELRADAEAYAERAAEAARLEVDAQRAASRQDAKDWRGEALAALKEMRARTSELLADQEKEHAEGWDALGLELAAAETATDARLTELGEFAARTLGEAQRFYAEAEEAARHGQEDAQARGDQIVAEARVRAERVERETDRVLREHDERREELTSHMTHVRNTLAALTGKALPEPEPEPEVEPEPELAPEVAPEAVPEVAPVPRAVAESEPQRGGEPQHGGQPQGQGEPSQQGETVREGETARQVEPPRQGGHGRAVDPRTPASTSTPASSSASTEG
ncbi:cellulose-binding protein [Streptomyces sp. H27-D2]|uniref:cellulose-binding protein n=1 Tax=Streptomyces sp. H27-D2 TaxID=3046304 RepID=UPI002DBF2E70|nr:cellulose-binding protein [Streptomyces sp. H27-D2]MEC4017300.1 cellulose-binding protein [Streptomyces sp. H27-D2]